MQIVCSECCKLFLIESDESQRGTCVFCGKIVRKTEQPPVVSKTEQPKQPAGWFHPPPMPVEVHYRFPSWRRFVFCCVAAVILLSVYIILKILSR